MLIHGSEKAAAWEFEETTIKDDVNKGSGEDAIPLLKTPSSRHAQVEEELLQNMVKEKENEMLDMVEVRQC